MLSAEDGKQMRIESDESLRFNEAKLHGSFHVLYIFGVETLVTALQMFSRSKRKAIAKTNFINEAMV